jgi:hypothetical protein
LKPATTNRHSRSLPPAGTTSARSGTHPVGRHRDACVPDAQAGSSSRGRAPRSRRRRASPARVGTRSSCGGARRRPRPRSHASRSPSPSVVPSTTPMHAGSRTSGRSRARRERLRRGAQREPRRGLDRPRRRPRPLPRSRDRGHRSEAWRMRAMRCARRPDRPRTRRARIPGRHHPQPVMTAERAARPRGGDAQTPGGARSPGGAPRAAQLSRFWSGGGALPAGSSTEEQRRSAQGSHPRTRWGSSPWTMLG